MASRPPMGGPLANVSQIEGGISARVTRWRAICPVMTAASAASWWRTSHCGSTEVTPSPRLARTNTGNATRSVSSSRPGLSRSATQAFCCGEKAVAAHDGLGTAGRAAGERDQRCMFGADGFQFIASGTRIGGRNRQRNGAQRGRGIAQRTIPPGGEKSFGPGRRRGVAQALEAERWLWEHDHGAEPPQCNQAHIERQTERHRQQNSVAGDDPFALPDCGNAPRLKQAVRRSSPSRHQPQRWRCALRALTLRP